VATEVIEHLLDPSEFVKKLKTLVKPDGCIILTTPNKSFFPDSVVWESSLPPIHHWWLTEKSLSVLSEKIGMGVTFTDFSKRYGIWNTQVWNVNNLDIAYQGADQSIATKIRFGQVARRKTKNFLTSLPILMFLATKTMEMLKVRKYIYAGSKCHCMGVILNTHVPD
jgi:SAM-dependent methyltransferase